MNNRKERAEKEEESEDPQFPFSTAIPVPPHTASKPPTMWPNFGRSSSRVRQITYPRDSSSSPVITFSSLKDVLSLFPDDNSSSTLKRSSSIYHRVRVATSVVRTLRSLSSQSLPEEKRIVVYFTSLRVVRRTYEDCRTVRSILRGLRVVVDERDLAMDSRFLNELKGILGKKQLTLPRVFIGGRYMGGAEEIRQLHESGELKKFIEGVPFSDGGVCECCGGVRFVLCQNCNGSHKFYTEKGGFRSCSSCNENGLVRCTHCCRCEVI